MSAQPVENNTTPQPRPGIDPLAAAAMQAEWSAIGRRASAGRFYVTLVNDGKSGVLLYRREESFHASTPEAAHRLLDELWIAP